MNPAPDTQPDPALLELFQAEMDAHIPILSEGLLALERGQVAEPDIAAMMRAAHSIKGAARIVGIEAAVRISHVMEDCFLAARDGRVVLSGAAVDTLLRGVDALQRICSSQPPPTAGDAWLVTLHQQITAVRDGLGPTVAPATSVPGERFTAPAADIHPAVQPPEIRITVPPDFDAAAAEELRRSLAAALQHSPGCVRLDLAGVRHVSAAALALLGALARDAGPGAPGARVLVDGAPAAVATLLRIAGLERAWAQPA